MQAPLSEDIFVPLGLRAHAVVIA